jgi:hypothetical protein
MATFVCQCVVANKLVSAIFAAKILFAAFGLFTIFIYLYTLEKVGNKG